MAVPNSGFESPVVGYGNYQYAPAGVTGNQSAFNNNGGADAPEGAQAAFLQGTGATITQSVSGFQANVNYVVTFAAAQRPEWNQGGQDFQVYIDNTLIGTFHPPSTSYADYATTTFTPGAGAHVLKFVSVNSLGGDHTAFVDNVRVTGSPSPTEASVRWLVADRLGTPRMVIDQTGSLAGVSRHDYLPFGEEIGAGVGGRTIGQGYTAADNLRQKFTRKERDMETGLDYFGSRYFASGQGRFTSPDVFWKDSQVSDPQSWNKYTYVRNNPLKYIDPNGEKATVTIETDETNKRAKIIVHATVALWTSRSSGLSQKDLEQAGQQYKENIEKTWSGSFEYKGFQVEVSVTVDVQAFQSKDAAYASFDGNVQNVLEVKPAGPHSFIREASMFGGPDRGEIAFDAGIRKNEAGHEFSHMLGVDDRRRGSYLANTWGAQRAEHATNDDYRWAFGDAIDDHRTESRPYIATGRQWETLNAGGGRRGDPQNHKSTRELGAPTSLGWWR